MRRQIDALAQAADNATASNPDLYQSDLDTIRSDLDTAKSDYEVFTSDQDNRYTHSYCDDASSLAKDVTSIRQDIKSMHADVKSNTDPGQIDSDVQNLRDQFAAMQSFDPSLTGPDVPTQDDIDAAIRAAREKVKGAGGANFTGAGKLLAKPRRCRRPLKPRATAPAADALRETGQRR